MLAAKIIAVLVVLLTIVVPIGAYSFFGKKTRRSFIRTLAVNLLAFFAALVISELVIFTGTVQAAEEAASSGTLATGLGYIAAGLSVGFACIGSGIAVSSSASAALGALSEDSGILGKSLIFVGLSEGIALYGLIISFMILGAL